MFPSPGELSGSPHVASTPPTHTLLNSLASPCYFLYFKKVAMAMASLLLCVSALDSSRHFCLLSHVYNKNLPTSHRASVSGVLYCDPAYMNKCSDKQVCVSDKQVCARLKSELFGTMSKSSTQLCHTAVLFSGLIVRLL